MRITFFPTVPLSLSRWSYSKIDRSNVHEIVHVSSSTHIPHIFKLSSQPSYLAIHLRRCKISMMSSLPCCVVLRQLAVSQLPLLSATPLSLRSMTHFNNPPAVLIQVYEGVHARTKQHNCRKSQVSHLCLVVFLMSR